MGTAGLLVGWGWGWIGGERHRASWCRGVVARMRPRDPHGKVQPLLCCPLCIRRWPQLGSWGQGKVGEGSRCWVLGQAPMFCTGGRNWVFGYEHREEEPPADWAGELPVPAGAGGVQAVLDATALPLAGGWRGVPCLGGPAWSCSGSVRSCCSVRSQQPGASPRASHVREA